MQSHLSSHLPLQAAIALANLHLTAKSKHELSLLSPSLHSGVFLCQSLAGPGQSKSCSLHPSCEASACRQRCRQHCRQQSTQEPVVWQRAPACSMQPVQPCGFHPPQPRRGNGSAASRGFWMGGEAAASPVPGRANLGLVEQCYKYLPLRDPVMQPRSRKGKRCPPAGLRASVPAQRSPVAPSPLMSWFMARAPGVQSPEVAGAAVGGSCGQAQAAFLPPAQKVANASPTDPSSAPQPPQTLLYKHP